MGENIGEVVTEPKLPEDFKKRWLEALRSGQYEQGKNFLQDKDKYCCLGVACRINHPNFNFDKIGLVAQYDSANDGFTFEDITIPDILKGSYDRKDKDYSPTVKNLVDMNDSGITFNEIAEWIERNL